MVVIADHERVKLEEEIAELEEQRRLLNAKLREVSKAINGKKYVLITVSRNL